MLTYVINIIYIVIECCRKYAVESTFTNINVHTNLISLTHKFVDTQFFSVNLIQLLKIKHSILLKIKSVI